MTVKRNATPKVAAPPAAATSARPNAGMINPGNAVPIATRSRETLSPDKTGAVKCSVGVRYDADVGCGRINAPETPAPKGRCARTARGHEYPRGANLGPSYRDVQSRVLWRARHTSHGRKGEAMGKSISCEYNWRGSIEARLKAARFHTTDTM